MNTQQELMIAVTTPTAALNRILDAISAAGGGILGNYSHCAYISTGQGHFKPEAAANPHIGTVEQINTVDEVRIETFCSRAVAKAVVQAIRAAHPYEEPVIYIIPLLSEDDL